MSARRVLFAALALVLASSFGGCAEPEPAPITIGVLLPLSSRDAGDLRAPLAWAVDAVNDAGGVAGRPIELRSVDLAAEPDVRAAAVRLAADPSVVAVVGPDTSRALFDVAQIFIDAHKPLVSPSATAGDIFRAFGGKKYVWRTVESDVAQAQTLLTVARRDGASRVAVIVSDDAYGGTFYDWLGFFAKELGMSVTGLELYDAGVSQDCAPIVERARLDRPDVLVVVPTDAAAAACFGRAVADVPAAERPRVLYSDSADDPEVVAALGPAAEGMEGLTAVADPASGFDAAYGARFGAPMPPYASRAYDAVTLLAYGLERSGGAGGEALADALAEVVDARGAPTAWDEVGDALASIRRGELPNLTGSAGPLDFDLDYHTDLVASTYGRWRVRDGRYVVEETLSTAKDRAGGAASIYRSLASAAHAQDFTFAGGAPPKARRGLWAVVVATTKGWNNYRHRADALGYYQALKAHGVGDDRIVLATSDDLATDPANRAPGVVRHVAGGPNLRAGATFDYRLADLTLDDLGAVLRGSASARTPSVLGATDADDVVLFLTGHGSIRGLDWAGADEAGALFTPAALADIVGDMQREARFRRMLIVVDSCDAGSMGEVIAQRKIPGVMLLASSTPHEDSLATNWDPSLGVWLADELSFRLARAIESAPSTSLLDLYRDMYLHVPGSHVTAYNANVFADLSAVRLADFVTP